MPTKALPAALYLSAVICALPGCASLGTERGKALGPDAVIEALFPSGEDGEGLRGEAEVTISLMGRDLSLPGAVLLDPSGALRIDLLDPLDRPAAIIFLDGGRLVQYRPVTSQASAVDPLPGDCGGLAPGIWIPFLLGAGPSQRSSYRLSGWPAGRSLERYEKGLLKERIRYRVEGEVWRPEKTTWYCGARAAIVLEFGAFGPGEGRLPESFTVIFPQARLRMEMVFGRIETGAGTAGALLRPALPPTTRWTKWELAGEQ